ncbi:wax ester/triacylglycerol synthase family O-acyltransferase [Nocardioides sp. GY 10113]|uniref:WS/DGAT/MGAT family O-acyltransferase n=1 Tax=Nocardioides sp. GY 10113 TaxID=2569761 RepID=UPI0010A92B7C|nr:wax ester/triacylglycerol synthase family O-acyltransferase [Nocardioides sp. GY 10113]TIC83899.1 wax ester/triacylglycerol synthase family O-acyltransferase [Nocardioides sp. GY 10113]
MERLSGLDASFLYLETPAQLMHVCAVLVIDPSTMPEPYSFPRFQRALDARVRGLPTFLRKIRGVPLGLDHPVWVEDRNFDIERHLHRLALPTPGGYAELMELAAHFASLPLDRSRPLWEMWVIEGYTPDPGGGERIAVLVKSHHATVDGVSGANLLSHLCALEPDAEFLSVEERPLGGDPTRGALLGRAVIDTVTKPLNLVRVIKPSVSFIANTIGRAREGTAMAAPFSAPRTAFNGIITGRRAIALADLSLDEIREVKRDSGATVNDVVLTIVGGALRAYLEGRGELPDTTLLAAVPVSVREASNRAEGANKVSALFCKLGTDLGDPLERLRLLAERNRYAKEHHDAIGADTLQDWAEFAAPRTFGLAVRAYAALRLPEKHPVVHNLVVSNVPGPPIPLYFMGGRIEGLYPLGPVYHGSGLNITVMSNAGRVHVGAIACRESVPDVETLVREFPRELERLRKEVAERGAEDRAEDQVEE